MTARELTSRVSLTLPDGRLNPASVGWARQPIVDDSTLDSGRWGRRKRWEHWNITTPTHIMALTVSSLDYVAAHEVWVFDRQSEKYRVRSAMVPLARGAHLAPSAEEGASRARARRIAIDIEPWNDTDGTDAAGTRVRGRIPGASFDVIAVLPPGHERLAVVVPWSETRFQSTVKDVARPAHGSVTFDDRTYAVPAGESWAVLDHGRGRWPYAVEWVWGAGSGLTYGRVIGIQVGGRWTEGTGMTENAIVVDGRLHKIHEELTWEYEIGQWRRPWIIRGGGLDASFMPFYDKVTRRNLGVVAGATDQCFGYWSGTFRTDEGESIPFDGVLGWAEEGHSRS